MSSAKGEREEVKVFTSIQTMLYVTQANAALVFVPL